MLQAEFILRDVNLNNILLLCMLFYNVCFKIGYVLCFWVGSHLQ